MCNGVAWIDKNKYFVKQNFMLNNICLYLLLHCSTRKLNLLYHTVQHNDRMAEHSTSILYHTWVTICVTTTLRDAPIWYHPKFFPTGSAHREAVHHLKARRSPCLTTRQFDYLQGGIEITVKDNLHCKYIIQGRK